MTDLDTGEIGIEPGYCALCGKPTTRATIEGVEKARGEDKEPLVCNRCLVDLRGDMATELEVRRQLGNLEARVESVDGKVENTNTRLHNSQLILNLVLLVLGGVLGVATTLVLGG